MNCMHCSWGAAMGIFDKNKILFVPPCQTGLQTMFSEFLPFSSRRLPFGSRNFMIEKLLGPPAKYTHGTTPRTRCRVQCSTEVQHCSTAALNTIILTFCQSAFSWSAGVTSVPRSRGTEKCGQIVILIPLLSILHRSPGRDKLQADGKCKC